jgi:CRISPR type III-B/RAMP module-associated protein Cmr3
LHLKRNGPTVQFLILTLCYALCYPEIVTSASRNRLDSKKEYQSQESRDEHHQDITMSRTGIGLEVRRSGSKSAREGFLYTAEFVDYQKLGKAKTAIAVDVFGLDDKLPIINRASIRLGGEGRISLISVSQPARLLRELEERVWKSMNDYEGELALYVATPILIEGGQSVREYLTGWAGKLGIHFSDGKGNWLKGESGIMGAGFSILSRRRKPIYTTVEPGSIIYLEGRFDVKTIYKQLEVGEAAGIGFGTLIPVPLTR